VRVLQALGWYFPDSLGGTEVYVKGLAARLQRAGVDVCIVAPRACERVEQYSFEGVQVFRYPDAAVNGARARDSHMDHWIDVLDRVDPHIVDFHSLTSGLSLDHLRIVKQRATQAVVTIHVPLVCQRGTLLRFGRVPCDGDLSRRPCAACRLHARGIPRPLASASAYIPAIVKRQSRTLPLPPFVRAVLEANNRAAEHRDRLNETFACADRVVAVSRWLADTLLCNGLPADKLAICPQGVDRRARHAPANRGDRLRVGFIGRYDKVKGLHVLVDAIRRLPKDLPIECRVWGIASSAEARSYFDGVVRRAARDPRIVFLGSADSSEALASIDVLAIPSIWMETGPLVLLEAFAAGVPVIGSNLGGIAEKIRHGVDGWLVAADDARELSQALSACARDRTRVEAWRSQIPAVRTMDEVAGDTHDLYRSLVRESVLTAT